MASAGQEASLFAVVFCLTVVAGNACLSLHGDAPATANFTQLAEDGGQVTANFTDLTAAAGLPATLDWRARGAVTIPKQQEKLGSCWAFAAVAAIEGLQQIRTAKLVTLSAQQLIDCAPETKTHRSPRNAFEWVHENGGITSDADYPYTGEAGKCVKSKLKHYSAQITGFRRTNNASELALMAALQKQPVAVSMALAGPFFTEYKAGTIYEGPCVQKNNHAMTVVGYGQSKKGKLYWIIKNSFGPKWGNGGYVLVKHGVNSNDGSLCGIARRAIYRAMAAN